MPLVTLSPCIISLQDLDALVHIALTRPEMPDFSLKIGLLLSAWALAVGLVLVRVWMPGLDKAEALPVTYSTAAENRIRHMKVMAIRSNPAMAL